MTSSPVPSSNPRKPGITLRFIPMAGIGLGAGEHWSSSGLYTIHKAYYNHS